MANPGVGYGLHQLADRSFTRQRRVFFFCPEAADDDLIVTTVDPSTMAVSDFFTLTTPGAALLRYARKITMTINDDDAGGGLVVTALVKAMRFGLPVEFTLTATSTTTNDTTVTSDKVVDQIISIQLTGVTADTGDDVTFGIDGTALGLPFPVDNLEDVHSMHEIAGTTEAAALTVDATNFSVAESAILNLTIAATEAFEIDCLISNGIGKDGIGSGGSR